LVREYRSRVPFVAGLIVAVVFLLLGIAAVVPTSTSDVAQNVVGGFVIVVACFGGSISWTNGVLLTPEGIVKRQAFRRMTIPWGAVARLEVAPVPRNAAWSTVRVKLRPRGYAYLAPVAGSKRYIRQVIAEFEEYRATLG
jgi:hypothetical protein